MTNNNLPAENVADAFTTLNVGALGLFQARKLGVYVQVPAEVREQMVAAYGQDAERVLALIDGEVDLSCPTGVSDGDQSADWHETAGPQSSAADKQFFEDKLRQLNAIARTLNGIHNGVRPRADFALVWGVSVFAILLCVDYVNPGLWQPTWVRPLFAALVVAWVYFLRSNKPMSLYGRWENQMAAYDPVNKSAYRWLQDKVTRNSLETYHMFDWVAQERAALTNAIRGPEATRSAFENKVV